MKNDTKHLRMDTMLHICEGFNITLKDFFDSPLFNNVSDEDDDFYLIIEYKKLFLSLSNFFALSI